MAAYKAFRDVYLSSDQANLINFNDWDARKLRYALLWAMYENSAYQSVQTWATSYKTIFGLYKYTRGVYNPSYRLGEFWKDHLLGGSLDPQAGDGSEVPSCLPIDTDNDNLRPAIAQIWKWSNWTIKKNVFGLWTPVLGDGVLQVVDDTRRGKVYLKVIHPSRLRDLTLDDMGNVKGYVLEWQTPDPRNPENTVTYREVATRNEDQVVYTTYLNESPYGWNGNPVQWVEGYGFIPMVVLQHNDVGLDWGFSESYPGLAKFREVDDQASKLNDQVRKMVEGAWLFAGTAKPPSTPTPSGQTATDERPQPGREEMKVLYSSSADAKAQSLVSNLDISATSANIKQMLEEIERDFPELRLDLANANQDTSGRALRYNRAPAEAKVMARRANYDDAIVRAQQMAIAIAGMRGYDPVFSGFGLDSYNAGALDHSIGNRPVFDKDPLDDIELDTAFWTAANTARNAGIPLPVYLKQHGWDEEKINEVVNSEEYKNRLEASRMAAVGARAAIEQARQEPANRFPASKTAKQEPPKNSVEKPAKGD